MMHFKSFKNFTPVKKALICSGFIIILTLLFLISYLVISTHNVRRTALKSGAADEKASTVSGGWETPEIQKLWKEKLWLDNQLVLAKDDSMNLGIDFHDSIIQLQFKGWPLVKSRIRFISPGNFFSGSDSRTYQKIFGHPVSVVCSFSEVSKKPFRKILTDTSENSFPADTSSQIKNTFYWDLIADNNVRFVFYGIDPGADNYKSRTGYEKDILKFRLKSKKCRPVCKGYTPVLFIWLDAKEAKAIYRAVPDKVKINIRI